MHRSATLTGILCLLAGVAVFSVQDVILKQLSGNYPLSQAMTVRSLIALPLMLWIVRRQDGSLATLTTRGWRKMLLRGLLNVTAYTCYYLGLAVMPMATTVALYFAAPLFICLLAPVLLREPVSRVAIIAALAGFAGVLVVIDPQSGTLGIAALFPILGALGYALSMIAARPLGRTESAAAMACWGNIGFLICALVLSAVFGTGAYHSGAPEVFQFLTRPWVTTSLSDFALMGSCGAIAAVGLTLLTQAYRSAPSSLVAPFEYSFMLWAVLFGWVFWSELPDMKAWLGIAIIIVAGLYVLRQVPAPAK